MKKSFFASFMVLYLSTVFLLALAFNIQTVKASGTIYIKTDGSIDPPTANITSADNVTYYFTSNNHDSIVVERDNIVVDGAGYTLQGTEAILSKGIAFLHRNNITIKNMRIKGFRWGIHLYESSNNSISGNSVTTNEDGIELRHSNYNSIVGNNITANNYRGIGLFDSSNHNSIVGNNITNWYGIGVFYSSNNSIVGNDVINNYVGIELESSNYNTIVGNNIVNEQGIGLLDSSNNVILHNNFINNEGQVYTYDSVNIWDDGYPSGGNYWSDYEERYPDAKELDGSGVWDTPYVIDENNQDAYPIIPEFPSFLLLPILMISALLATILYRRKHGIPRVS